MSQQPYRVLLIDDDALLVSLVGRRLRAEGFQVRSTDGTVGVTTTVRAFQPHLILLDVHLSGMPGERLLMPLRRNAAQGTLVILYSAIAPDRLQALATSVQADGWISKNDENSTLGRKLHALLNRSPT